MSEKTSVVITTYDDGRPVERVINGDHYTAATYLLLAGDNLLNAALDRVSGHFNTGHTEAPAPAVSSSPTAFGLPQPQRPVDTFGEMMGRSKNEDFFTRITVEVEGEGISIGLDTGNQFPPQVPLVILQTDIGRLAVNIGARLLAASFASGTAPENDKKAILDEYGPTGL